MEEGETVRWMNEVLEIIWPIFMESFVSQVLVKPLTWFLDQYKPWTAVHSFSISNQSSLLFHLFDNFHQFRSLSFISLLFSLLQKKMLVQSMCLGNTPPIITMIRKLAQPMEGDDLVHLFLPLMCCIFKYIFDMFDIVRVCVPTYTWSPTVKKST